MQSDKIGISSNNPRRKKWPIFVVIGVIVLAALGAAGWWAYQKYIVPEQQAQQKREDLLNAPTSTGGDQAKILDEYKGDYDTAVTDTETSNPSKWTKKQLDETYLIMLYNDKTGGSTDVLTALQDLEFAKESGVNIDDNSYGITQSDRDAMEARANARQQDLLNGSEDSNE